jgi:cyclopropane-fatty-acyl-phospholipid synthase
MAELASQSASVAGAARSRESWFAAIVRRRLAEIQRGTLTILLPSGERVVLRGASEGPEAVISVARPRAFLRLALDGDLGFAEGFRDGDWRTTDLTAVLRFASANEAALSSLASGSKATRLVQRLRHHLRRNTRANSRRNVQAHYDLGNEFYAAWLDPGMNYSAGIYSGHDTSLESAQAAKLAHVADMLELQGHERVLEIGCGWGPLTQHLTERGCNVTALTLSPRQRAYAQARLDAAGLSPRADIRLQDYRDVTGTFDRVASIEMFEAVGEAYWPVYFDAVRSSLSPGGIAVLQVITIEPSRFETYRHQPDFIQSYIFPGGMLPTEDILAREGARAGLTLTATERFADGYARTLADWRTRFETAWPSIAAMGFDDRFKRLWEYYLSYCQVGFETRALCVGLYSFRRD